MGAGQVSCSNCTPLYECIRDDILRLSSDFHIARFTNVIYHTYLFKIGYAFYKRAFTEDPSSRRAKKVLLDARTSFLVFFMFCENVNALYKNHPYSTNKCSTIALETGKYPCHLG